MTADGNSITIIMSLISGIIGSVVGVLGSKWIADSAVKKQEKEKEQSHIQDRLGAYTSLWRFLKESNNRAVSHPSFKKMKGCTHVLNSPADYEWLRNHFTSARHLLSDRTYSLYLESFSKDRLGIAIMTSNAPKSIPTNYMALQDEVKEMCDKLEGMLDKPAKSDP